MKWGMTVAAETGRVIVEAPGGPVSCLGPVEESGEAGLPASESDGVSVFAALADPTRRRMLEVLVESGRASATVLARQLPVSRQAVVKHFRILEAAGLVGEARVGREVLFFARVTPLEASARWLTDLSAAVWPYPNADTLSDTDATGDRAS